MPADPVLCDVEGGIAVITLANPPLNLVTLELTRALDRTLDRLAGDPEVRVLVVTGAGDRAFSAGSDIKEFPEVMDPGMVVEKKLRQENETYSKLDDFPKPTIAAVTGLAFGGGLELAVCCDLMVVDERARLALPEIRLGVIPGSGGTVRVARRIGEARAKEMMFFGEPIDARTAQSWGLANRVVPPGQALTVATHMAGVLAQRPGRALELCKQAIDLAFDTTEDDAIAKTLTLSDQVFASADAKEGVRAFFAKEEPRFSHA
jgi:enoyl-CoA hydratase